MFVYSRRSAVIAPENVDTIAIFGREEGIIVSAAEDIPEDEDEHDECCDCESCYEPEPEPEDHELFPVCPRCYASWEYEGTTNWAVCDSGHRWQEAS